MSHPPIEKKIRHAKIAAIISGIVTLAGSLVLIVKGKSGGVSLVNMLNARGLNQQEVLNFNFFEHDYPCR